MHSTATVGATFVLYLAGMLAIGILAYRRTRNLSDYLLGGRRLGCLTAALSAGASDMSGWLLLGLPGFAYARGYEAGWLALGLLVGTYANWRFIAGRLRVYTAALGDSITLSEYFENRFEDRSRILRIVSAFFILAFFLFYTSSGLVAGGKLFESVFGLPYLWAVLAGALAVIAYTFLGGFMAVCWTDCIQGLLMLLALVLVPIIAVAGQGGWGNAAAAMRAVDPALLAPFEVSGGLLAVASLVAWGLGYFGQPHILARFMAIRSPHDVPRARTIAMGWVFVGLAGALLAGFAGVGALATPLAGADAEKVFILLVQSLLHPVPAGICLAAILAAIMSTADSQLLVSSSALTEDFYKPFIRKRASQRELVWVGRLTVVVIATVAFVLAMNPDNKVLDLVAFAWGGFGAAFGPAIIMSLFWKRMTKAGAFAGILVGGTTVFVWGKLLGGGLFDLYEIVPGFVLSLAAIIAVSLLSRPPAGLAKTGWPAATGKRSFPAPAIVLALVVASVTTGASAAPGPRRIPGLTGRIVAVIEDGESDRVHDITLKIEERAELGDGHGKHFYLDDFFMIFLIENAHGLLFCDHVSRDISAMNLGVRFESVVVEKREAKGGERATIVEAEIIFPDYPASEGSFEYRRMNPVCPEPDYYHRYIRVPVSYDHPAWGEFELYYELCSDYDEGKRTIIVPTDGQRTLSQVGWADRYKRSFNTSLNVVTYEYRGMSCSAIDWLGAKDRDWQRIYEVLKSDNAVEDIERIRGDLPGGGKIYILGGSGTAMIGLKYLSKYHLHVERAFLMSFFKDARGSSEAGVRYFENFLSQSGLKEDFQRIVRARRVPAEQLLFLIQRLLYYDRDRAAELIRTLDGGDLTLYSELTKQLASVDFFVRAGQRYRPWAVVFMYETNISTSDDGFPDINYPFFRMAEPLNDLAAKGLIPGEKFDIPNLEEITTEILLVGGTLDQVAPIEETRRIHDALPRSKFAVFEAYHCLEQPPEARQARNDMLNLFFLYGSESEEFRAYLEAAGAMARFPDSPE